MEYKIQQPARPKLKPRLIIHGGAGNITPASFPPDRYKEYRTALLTIVSRAHSFMTTPSPSRALPSAVSVAAHAVTLLEDNALFNAGHGAVFTRDGTNELEASIMVSRGRLKRGVGVSGLRHVRNPIELARAILERGDGDLQPKPRARPVSDDTAGAGAGSGAGEGEREGAGTREPLDVPSAQGHTHLHGAAAEQLAAMYGLRLVPKEYFFTARRWEEHRRALERERTGAGIGTWSRDEYLPQGTCGAVALDEDWVICCATSTGGLTNKLSGRIGDTPTVGAGFWAEEWTEPFSEKDNSGLGMGSSASEPMVMLSGALRGLMADCLPTPWVYSPVPARDLVATRSVAVSGTGNGDSFLRTAAARTVGSIANFAGQSSAVALSKVAGRGGILERSAGDRWGRTGEGEGGMIGIECLVVTDGQGNIVETRSAILQDYNCGGMFRAWIDDKGVAVARIWREDRGVPGPDAGGEKLG
ncbi:beta-aspartyl-peptidase [Madurella fahalii]|uniref:Beta-aspartyl-peptidase n=1 Tax=Madurella fahalii TaxID=1157608 RepID=A0ABQ0GCW3_9PEZI